VHTRGGTFFDDRPLTLEEQEHPNSIFDLGAEFGRKLFSVEDEVLEKKKPQPKRRRKKP